MKRPMGAAVAAAVLCLSGLAATGVADAQVLSTMPPPTFGSRLLGSSEAGNSFVLPIVEEQINVDIDGQYASTRLRQTFHNRSDNRVEGLYTLRAGPGAKADGFAYWNGEQKIVGEVFERGVARQVYQNVTRRRRDPGLLEETGDGTFSFAVSPIEPGERKRVEVSYGNWLARHVSTVELHTPVTLADSAIAVTIWDGRELRDITSPTHHVDVQRMSSGRYLVRSHKVKAETSELVLRYQVADKAWTPAGYAHRDKDQDTYFTLTLAAPELPSSAAMAKDVTLVIDRSGSMMGEAIRQARAAAIDIVKRLRSDDRLNILLFDHAVEKLFSEPRPVTEAIRRQAIEYLEMMDDGGATDLAAALEQALATQTAGNRPRVVLFFTDGRSDVPPVLAAMQADKRDVRVFTVGFGSEVNKSLLARLAAQKRGRFTYIAAAANIEREVSTLYRQIEAPVLVDVSLEASGGAISRVYPPTLPDLFVDDELRINGRLRASGPVTLTIKGKQGGRAFSRAVKLDGNGEIKRPWVARQWAGARVDDLLDEIELGGARPELQNEVLDLALAYNFATPYTAFLAVPASEVDWQSAHQIANARAYKADILRRKPDAARAAGRGTPAETDVATGGISDNSQPLDRLLSGEGRARTQAAPPPSRELAENESPVSAAGSESALEEEVVQPRKKSLLGRKSKVGSDEGGCASCALGGGGDMPLAALAFAGMFMIVVARRRRSAPRPRSGERSPAEGRRVRGAAPP
jgi:Ca-activated chloride channel family protein